LRIVKSINIIIITIITILIRLSMASGFFCQRGFSPDIQRLSELKSEQKNHYKADSLQNNSILLYTFKTFSAINEQKQH
jgi:hypothetical protein